MRADRAWVRLGSGRRLDLLDLRPDAWTDEDLTTGLARTYPWGGHSCWELPLSVAQHSLTVLAIGERMQGRALTPAAARTAARCGRGLLGFDCITPLKHAVGRSLRPTYRAPASDYRRVLPAQPLGGQRVPAAQGGRPACRHHGANGFQVLNHQQRPHHPVEWIDDDAILLAVAVE